MCIRDSLDVYNFLLAMTMGDTQLHEIGHTVGLRHNFSGSTDALNFGPKYWELKGYTLEGGQRPAKEWALLGSLAQGMELALEEGLRDNQDSTVMDYASTYGTTSELGAYDLAAIKYAYGDVVEVFNSPDITAERAALLRQGELHYSYYPEVISDAATYADRVASVYDRGNVNYRKVPETRVEVPYSFCSDEYRDASATCAIWDQGADNYERTAYMADIYRNYAIFNQFKRERLTFEMCIRDRSRLCATRRTCACGPRVHRRARRRTRFRSCCTKPASRRTRSSAPTCRPTRSRRRAQAGTRRARFAGRSTPRSANAGLSMSSAGCMWHPRCERRRALRS